MAFNPANHHRHSIRLRGHDYSKGGTYFVTLCVRDRKCLFGGIKNGTVVLNDAGEIAKICWIDIPRHFPHAQTDEFVVMPNHVHGILMLRNFPVGATDPVAPFETVAPLDTISKCNHGATGSVAPTENTGIGSKKRAHGPPAGSLGAIVGQYKSVVTKRINARGLTPGKFLWQRDFYDHIGRDEDDLNRIRQYIRNNPANWYHDDKNPIIKSPRYVAMPNPHYQ